jgi:rhodanese-related sulfurtransferase
MWGARGVFVTVLVLGLAGLAPSGAQTPETQKVPVEGGGTYTDVSARGLARLLETKNFPLINVHIPYEGEIAGTDAFIPFNQVEANLGKLPANKGAKLVLYCRSGSMSAIAARTLVRLGYTDVWNLDGGMIAWRQAAYPLVQKAR